MTGRERIRAEFEAARRDRRTVLVPYLVAGYPSFRRCRELVWEAQEAGAGLVELGIPFSDPVADGPTLQAAIRRALESGVTVRRSLAFVRALRREGLVAPILGMTYANLLHAPGYARAARDWAEAGLDGAIVPDVPLEEAGPLRGALRARGLGTVSFASPATRPARLRRALGQRDSFLYLVAVYGTTGARRELAPETRRLLSSARRARRGPDPPVCVGFGVSRPAHVAALRRLGADGVVVGSAIVSRIDEGAHIGRYLRGLARAAR